MRFGHQVRAVKADRSGAGTVEVVYGVEIALDDLNVVNEDAVLGIGDDVGRARAWGYRGRVGFLRCKARG